MLEHRVISMRRSIPGHIVGLVGGITKVLRWNGKSRAKYVHGNIFYLKRGFCSEETLKK